MAAPTRRSLVAGCAGAAVLALCGCGVATDGDAAGGGDGDGPADLTDLRLATTAGFTSAAIAFRTLPELVLTPDGRILTPDAVPEIYPGPLLLPLSTRDVDAAGRAALAEAVLDSGLLTDPPPDFGVPGIADAPTTVLRLTLDGSRTTLTADALFESGDDAGLGGDQQRARAAFRDLVGRLRDLEATVGAEHLGEPSPYRPDGVWLRTFPAPTDRTAGTPAPEVLPWPVDAVDLSALETPTVVTGEAGQEVLAVLEDATELTWYRAPGATADGAVYEVLARPALPGDPDDGSL